MPTCVKCGDFFGDGLEPDQTEDEDEYENTCRGCLIDLLHDYEASPTQPPALWKRLLVFFTLSVVGFPVLILAFKLWWCFYVWIIHKDFSTDALNSDSSRRYATVATDEEQGSFWIVSSSGHYRERFVPTKAPPARLDGK